MKLFRKLGLAVAACLLAVGAFAYTAPNGASIFPLTYTTQPALTVTDAFNQMLGLINQQTVGISTQFPGVAAIPASGVDSSYTPFSTNLQGNPLVQYSYNTILTSPVPSATFLSGEASEAIIPAGLPIWTALGGTLSGLGVNIQLLCSGGTVLESINPLNLIGSTPEYTSTAGFTLNSAYMSGCPAGQSIQISATGVLATATSLLVNFPYVVRHQ